MLARLTNVDYERELALVVLDPEGRGIIAVGRYAPSVDDANAEFALTVADAWQAKGIGRMLLAPVRPARRARLPAYTAASSTATRRCSSSRRGWDSSRTRATAPS